MKICIFGAGAIGGYMGVKLALAGADVSLVARGPHLAAMQTGGLTLLEEGHNPVTVQVTASDNPVDLGSPRLRYYHAKGPFGSQCRLGDTTFDW